ncbi:MAG: GntR family transcriptional regulator [Pseudomonadota bacterium]
MATNGTEIENGVAEHIRRSIFSGDLLPGTRLAEQRLADIFNISRARVRSVLQTLAQQQLITLLPNRGALVATPTEAEARDVFDARRAIESMMAGRASRVVLTHQLAALRVVVEQQEIANQTGQLNAALHSMGRFHVEVAKLANNQVLVTVLQPLIARTSLIIATFGHHQSFLPVPECQSKIVDALAAGTPLDASRAMERALYMIEGQLDWKTWRRKSDDLGHVLARARAA